ncbi:MAG: hypothetical protein MJ147_00425 [Clostridia bacterium]|nr:hypothetical protein [Clostridia bacterium]
MENKKSDLTNPLSAEKARAEDWSGLSHVFEQFENGVDIQPLDDLVQEKPIPFVDNVELEEIQRAAAEEKAFKKARVKRFFGFAAAITAVICLMTFVVYNVYMKLDDFAHSAVAVYQRDENVQVLLDNGKTLELDNVVEAKLSQNGDYLVYSQHSTTKTGKLDLRMVELKKRASVKNKGTLAVSGADKGWKASDDCAYVYYTLSEDNTHHSYAYLTANKKNEPFAFDANETFLPPSGDIVYFTRETEKGTQLFRMRIGDKASLISDVSGVKGFTDETNLEIFYTVANDGDNSSYTLYKISGDSEPVKIAPDVSEVYLDDYKIGGNLYYFVKSGSKLNWGDFIIDNYSDTDDEIEKPKKEDYTYTIGFIFKRKKVNQNAYDQAVARYNKKAKRDEIRKALDAIDLGLTISSEYKIKVYDGEKSRELTGGVTLENLMAFSQDGMPKIIIKKSGIGLDTKVSMDSLYQIAEKNDVNQAVNYAIETLKSSGYEINYGYKYIFYNGSNVYEYNFNPSYNVDDTVFLFGGKNSIFAAVRDNNIRYNIFYCRVENGVVTPSIQMAQSATSFQMKNDNLYITIASQNINNDLYICTSDGKCELVSENTVKYEFQKDSVVILQAKEDEEVIRDVELCIYKNGVLYEIDGGVYSKSILVKKDKIAYLKNYKDPTYDGDSYGGTLVVYSDNKPSEICALVSAVLDVK